MNTERTVALSAAVRGAAPLGVGMDHVVELRHGEIRIADQRIVDLVSLGLLDVADPALVVRRRDRWTGP
jgi:hypothetical protein